VLGVGGGIKLVLWDNLESGEGSWLKNSTIDIRTDYQHSGENEYIVKQKLERPGLTGPVLYSRTSSKASLLVFRFGVSMQVF